MQLLWRTLLFARHIPTNLTTRIEIICSLYFFFTYWTIYISVLDIRTDNADEFVRPFLFPFLQYSRIGTSPAKPFWNLVDPTSKMILSSWNYWTSPALRTFRVFGHGESMTTLLKLQVSEFRVQKFFTLKRTWLFLASIRRKFNPKAHRKLLRRQFMVWSSPALNWNCLLKKLLR